jgi:hypothetical protein
MTDAIDGVLEQFARRGPEFGPGLSNHGPMAVDALIALGRPDVIERWAEWYAPRLDDRPALRNPIDPADWREALGDIGRAGAWSAFFQREISERPWLDVLLQWTPRLLPGIMAGATHGILRTAHAVRSLERGESPQRLAELAEGLAYWAARYQELPTANAPSYRFSVIEAIGRVPVVPPERRGRFLIFDAVRAVDPDRFAPAINLVDTSGELDTFVSDITRTFARQYLAHRETAAIAFIHTVTAPSALRILAPHLPPDVTRDAMRYAWQACAAVYAAFSRSGAQPPAIGDAAPPYDDLIDRAVAARDEHAIKFTEACLREYRISADPVFLAAAADVTVRLRAS